MSRLTMVAILGVLVVLLSVISQQSVQAQTVGGANVTKLVFYNATGSAVTVMATINTGTAFDGCTLNTSDLVAKQISPTAGSAVPLTVFNSTPVFGWFTIAAGAKVQVYNTKQTSGGQNNYCLQALNFGFGQFPNVCPGVNSSCVPTFPDSNNNPQPGTPLPNGSNSFECNLNLPGTNNEAFDISCVNGANVILRATATPPSGGPYWNIGICPACGGNAQLMKVFTSTHSTQNSWVNIVGGCDDNCFNLATRCPRDGVQPYGATQCNLCPDPATTCGAQTTPACSPTGAAIANQFCIASNGLPQVSGGQGCSFNRSPGGGTSGMFGGTVQVTLMGPAVPGNCKTFTNPCPSLPANGVTGLSRCLSL